MIAFETLAASLSCSLKNLSGANVIPIQGVMGASSTHCFINARAIRILLSDGYAYQAGMLEEFRPALDAGVKWADKGLRSAYHHYNPITGAGLWKWPSASQKCSDYFNLARFYWARANYNQAIFMLGAAAHLVQDLCVPHHAFCNLFQGHLEYERWVERHKENYALSRGGIYSNGITPVNWVRQNALLSLHYFNLVASGASEDDYHRATDILLKRAQRTTAGFFYYFWQRVLR
ncbi:MAG: zinc dependent phospholipase C family protein [Bacillota bacterium]